MGIFWSILISLFVNPTVVFENGTVHVMCRIPRDPTNRWVSWGLENYSESGRQLDGEHAPITWESYIEHVPCGVDTAFCRVVRVNGTTSMTRAPLTVTGCQ